MNYSPAFQPLKDMYDALSKGFALSCGILPDEDETNMWRALKLFSYFAKPEDKCSAEYDSSVYLSLKHICGILNHMDNNEMFDDMLGSFTDGLTVSTDDKTRVFIIDELEELKPQILDRFEYYLQNDDRRADLLKAAIKDECRANLFEK